jgi:outer membrane protein assembly factor BamA
MNLAGQAISLSGRLYFGGADQAWARATWPWISGNHRSLELYAAKLKREDVRNGFNEDSREFTGKVGKYLGDSGRLSARLSLFDMGSDVAGITLSPDNQDKLVTVAVVGGIDTRDSFRAPRTGWKNELELGKTGGFLRGDGDFETIILDVRHWLPTGKSQRTMLSGLLTMQSGTIGVDVPTYLRYHIGGANSVRGYPVQGPDETLAGKNQLIATVEHAFTLMPVRRFDIIGLSFGLGLEAVALADAGLAWNNQSELAIDRTRAGIGAGLHLLVPGSELRFEVACNGRGDFQFHLASGSKPVAQRSRNR